MTDTYIIIMPRKAICSFVLLFVLLFECFFLCSHDMRGKYVVLCVMHYCVASLYSLSFLWGSETWARSLKMPKKTKNAIFLEIFKSTPLDMYNGLFKVYCIKPE